MSAYRGALRETNLTPGARAILICWNKHEPEPSRDRVVFIDRAQEGRKLKISRRLPWVEYKRESFLKNDLWNMITQISHLLISFRHFEEGCCLEFKHCVGSFAEKGLDSLWSGRSFLIGWLYMQPLIVRVHGLLEIVFARGVFNSKCVGDENICLLKHSFFQVKGGVIMYVDKQTNVFLYH